MARQRQGRGTPWDVGWHVTVARGGKRHLRDDAHRLVRVELELERRVRRAVEVAVALAVPAGMSHSGEEVVAVAGWRSPGCRARVALAVRVEVAAVLVADALEAVAGVAGRLAVVVAASTPVQGVALRRRASSSIRSSCTSGPEEEAGVVEVEARVVVVVGWRWRRRRSGGPSSAC